MNEMDKHPPMDPNIRIDGDVIRRLREEQNLTQLYVAKVVGVTPDTISRWENNRYPSIKTINAQRLAEALEVDIDKIIKLCDDVEDVSDAGEIHTHARRHRLYWLVGTACVLVVGISAVFRLFVFSPYAAVEAERLLPSYAAPGTAIPVKLTFSGVSSRLVVRETLPSGWVLIDADQEPDSYDKATGLMRWILAVADEPVYIHYMAQVPENATLHSLQKFSGELVLRSDISDQKRAGMLGANQLVVERVHWADLNADGCIDDNEMLEASYLAESAGDLPLGIEKLENLWMAEHYYWDIDSGDFVGKDKE